MSVKLRLYSRKERLAKIEEQKKAELLKEKEAALNRILAATLKAISDNNRYNLYRDGRVCKVLGPMLSHRVGTDSILVEFMNGSQYVYVAQIMVKMGEAGSELHLIDGQLPYDTIMMPLTKLEEFCVICENKVRDFRYFA